MLIKWDSSANDSTVMALLSHGLIFLLFFFWDSVLYSKMDFGSTQSIATTTWTPAWS